MSSLAPGGTCQQFTAVLSDYREGRLDAAAFAAARAHLAACPDCSGLLVAVNAAQQALAALPAVDPPPAWFAAVRRQTTGLAAAAHPAPGWGAQLWLRLRAPRFAMGLAMSLLAVAVVLNAADANLRTWSWRDLAPATVAGGLQRDFDRLRARGLDYIEDLRVVYEIEAALHQMRESPPPPPPSGHDRSQRLAPAPAAAPATTLG